MVDFISVALSGRQFVLLISEKELKHQNCCTSSGAVAKQHLYLILESIIRLQPHVFKLWAQTKA
jgi:hypothetical protein